MCVSVPHVCRYLLRSEEGVRSFGTGVTLGYEPPCVGAGTELWSSGRAVSTSEPFLQPHSLQLLKVSLLTH